MNGTEGDPKRRPRKKEAGTMFDITGALPLSSRSVGHVSSLLSIARGGAPDRTSGVPAPSRLGAHRESRPKQRRGP